MKTRDHFRSGILAALQEADHHGYCVANTTIRQLAMPDTGPLEDCCPAAAGGEHLCFAAKATKEYRCLPVRELLSKANATCLPVEAAPCPHPDDACLVPTFGDAAAASNTSTKLVRLGRSGDLVVKKDFLFVGNPAVIYTTVTLSDYCPRYSWLPTSLPDSLLKMARYVASFSGALAVLNVVPCYMLDGQHMMEVLMEMGLRGTCAVRRRRLQTTITLLGKMVVSTTITKNWGGGGLEKVP